MATTAARRAAWQTRVLLGVGWLGIVVASDLPAIIIGPGFAVNPQVYRLVTALILVALLALTASVSWLVALRGAMLALVALTIGQLARQLIEISPWWTGIVGRLPADVQILADSLVGFIPAALMVGASLYEGLDRADIYLAWGDLRASSSIGWRGHNLRWTTLGPILAVLFSVGLVVQLLLTVRPDASLVGRLPGAIPLALLFALVPGVVPNLNHPSVVNLHQVDEVVHWSGRRAVHGCAPDFFTVDSDCSRSAPVLMNNRAELGVTPSALDLLGVVVRVRGVDLEQVLGPIPAAHCVSAHDVPVVFCHAVERLRADFARPAHRLDLRAGCRLWQGSRRYREQSTHLGGRADRVMLTASAVGHASPVHPLLSPAGPIIGQMPRFELMDKG